MSIDIKKTGKNTYYRKDGNKMGGRKEKQEVLNISIKHWERDMTVKHRAGAKTMTGWGQFESMMAGGFKKGEMAMVGAICGAFPEDHFKSNVALAAVRAADRGNVVMIGMEHEFDHTDRLAEELKNHGKYMPYNRPIQLAYVDGVPYNTMDEFDRPNFYKEKQFIVDMPDSIYPKNPEEVLSEQFKIDVNNTHQKLVTDAINSFVNVNKPYKVVVDNEGKLLYPEIELGLKGVELIDKDLIKPELDTIDISKDKDFLDKYFEYNHYEHIHIESLVKVIDDILAKDNKEVLVIDKEDDSTYFSKTDNRYKSIVVNSIYLEINTEEAIFTDSYVTMQESLLKLLERIKGNEEFLVTYKHLDNIGVYGIISRKEWYMKKSKITLVIPDWMIEPKDVCEYMNSTGISEEEKEDTLIKRLNTLLEGTDYNWLIEEKMVPDAERTMLYNTRLVRGNFVTGVNELDNKFYYTKIEALAECYYFLRKSGLLTMEEVNNTWKKNEDNIGRGFTKPVFETCNKEELLFLIEDEMIDGSSYQVLQSTNEEGTNTYYNIEYNVGDEKTDVKEILHTWSKSEYEALSNFYTYLRENKKDKK